MPRDPTDSPCPGAALLLQIVAPPRQQDGNCAGWTGDGGIRRDIGAREHWFERMALVARVVASEAIKINEIKATGETIFITTGASFIQNRGETPVLLSSPILTRCQRQLDVSSFAH